MEGPDTVGWAARGLAAVLILVSLSCSGRRAPRPLASQTLSPEPPTEVPAEAPAPTPAPSPEPTPIPPRGTEEVVIDPGGKDAASGSESLVAAARAERARRAQTQRPVVVITNANLEEHAVGKLTEAQPETDAGEAEEDALASELERDETYWRQGIRDLRERWREAVERIEELQLQVADLRNRFYAQDDPYVRDGRIKPQWDQAMKELEDAKESAAQAEADVEQFLDDGRRAGALPGWLREGLELEPEDRPYDQENQEELSDDNPMVGEPQVIEDEDTPQ